MMSGVVDATLLSVLSQWEEENIGSSLSFKLVVFSASFVKLETFFQVNFSPATWTNSFTHWEVPSKLSEESRPPGIKEITFFYQIVQLVNRLCQISLQKRNISAWKLPE